MRYENPLWHVAMACGLIAACSNNDIGDDPLVQNPLDAGKIHGDDLTAQFNADIAGADALTIDSQIVRSAGVINNGAIQQAQFAVQASSDTTTIDYGNQMINAYTTLNQQLAIVAIDLQVVEVNTTLSATLTADTATAMTTMQTAAPNDLDLTYLQNQVLLQQSQLTLVDSMEQSAQSAELVGYLDNLRAVLVDRISRGADIIHDDF